MAIVNITHEVATSVIAGVRRMHEADREKIDNTLPDLPEGLGGALYGRIVPLDKQKQALELIGSNFLQRQHLIAVRVRGVTSTAWAHAPYLHVILPDDCIQLARAVSVEDIPGIKSFTWDGASCISIVLAEDTSVLPFSDEINKFLVKVAEIPARHAKVTKAAKEAQDLMRRFLEQHRTLQSALKAMGPALKAYFDPWITAQMDAPPPKRVRKAKEELDDTPLDLTKLIVKATTSKLNIN